MAKENPNDATFRNINALKKRVKCLERLSKTFYLDISKLGKKLKKVKK